MKCWTEGGAEAGIAGDARVGDDSVEGDNGGEALGNCLGESSSSWRGILRWRVGVFDLIIKNVKMLSGCKPST